MTAELSEKQMPAYLSEACVQKALEKALQTKHIQLQNWQWQLANTIGDNFNSNIYRISGNYSISKAVHKESSTVSDLKEFNFILKDVDMEIAEIGTNETVFFESVLPKMEQILEKVRTEEILMTSNKLAANCYLTESTKAHEFYILEDLNALGFKLADRCEGFSAKEAKLVMEKLAKFHAASMVYAKKFPKIVAALKPTHLISDLATDPMSEALQKKKLDFAMEILGINDEELLRRMEKFNLELNERLKNLLKPAKSAFNVLNHGDIWVNNVLLKTQGNGDAVFVDFQNVWWGSPTYDLNYFFYTCLPLKALKIQRVWLLDHYYKTLNSALVSLEHKNIPTWTDLLREFDRGALIGYYAAICEFPICVMSDEAAKDLTAETLLESTPKWDLVYKTPKVCEFIRYALANFIELGLFDE